MEAWLYLICGSTVLSSEKKMFKKPTQTRINQVCIILVIRQNTSSRGVNDQWLLILNPVERDEITSMTHTTGAQQRPVRDASDSRPKPVGAWY